ncbi:Alpha/Beta hydrolase protein [Roridomyces roridus]|uniref:Alpha/Beta hydrolase protein n=1 Tax=Roridomyces roridus TaxID=1738132 RepID=A0AAD7BDJ4_9AGAR|nr:Alpha/Beta hydrolase protein [Roridomyces roridus]
MAYILNPIQYWSRYFLYPHLLQNLAEPLDLGMQFTSETFTASDGVSVASYVIRQSKQSAQMMAESTWREDYLEEVDMIEPPENYDKPAVATVILFHGNACNYGDMIYRAKRFVLRRCNVVLLSYRGYVNSEGRPSEKGLRRDAQAALEYVRADTELSSTPLILYGTSLGGAVAIDLASRNPSSVAALIVENTFQSIRRTILDWSPIFHLVPCSEKWNSASKIPGIQRTMPILMLSGALDQVVRKDQMERLWEIACKRGGGGGASLDQFESFPRGSHDDTDTCTGYWDKVGEFLESVTE